MGWPSEAGHSPPTKDEIRITINAAVEAFIASRVSHVISVPTLKKYRTFTKQLLAYAESQGYFMLDQLDVSDMDRFYASWKDDKRSRAKKA